MTKVVPLVLALAVGAAACGLTQTRGPDPRQPADQRPSCTETMDAPKKDGIGAVLGLVSILAGGLILESDGDEAIGATLLVGGIVVMAGSYASGGIGYFRVKKCQRA